MMKKTIVAALMLTCLAGCGKNDSTTQKAPEPKPAEAQQYRPPTEWTRIDRSQLPGPKTQIINVYYRAVPSDEDIKGVKIEIGLQFEDDFKKYPFHSQGYAIVNCQKKIAQDPYGNILHLDRGRKYFEFACGIPKDIKIKETNAAAEVQAPPSVNKPVQTGFDGVFYTDRHSIRINNNNGSYTYEAWKQPKQLDEGMPDLEVKGGRIDDTPLSDCDVGRIVFKKGNLKMTAQNINESNRSCFVNAPSGAVGKLDIFINGVRKDHYWLYRN